MSSSFKLNLGKWLLFISIHQCFTQVRRDVVSAIDVAPNSVPSGNCSVKGIRSFAININDLPNWFLRLEFTSVEKTFELTTVSLEWKYETPYFNENATLFGMCISDEVLNFISKVFRTPLVIVKDKSSHLVYLNYIHWKANLWKFELNWSSKLRDNSGKIGKASSCAAYFWYPLLKWAVLTQAWIIFGNFFVVSFWKIIS